MRGLRIVKSEPPVFFWIFYFGRFLLDVFYFIFGSGRVRYHPLIERRT
jgi:hypothetical protein